ncbi:MAG: hypothetical protein RJA20_2954, partial [Bacteroidota bacterium]
MIIFGSQAWAKLQNIHLAEFIT